uniref:Uncharacterized protein n=1 Tax=Glossina austeni TaxID=7395 RepID=A0A1A9V1U5_GLOAU
MILPCTPSKPPSAASSSFAKQFDFVWNSFKSEIAIPRNSSPAFELATCEAPLPVSCSSRISSISSIEVFERRLTSTEVLVVVADPLPLSLFVLLCFSVSLSLSSHCLICEALILPTISDQISIRVACDSEET